MPAPAPAAPPPAAKAAPAPSPAPAPVAPKPSASPAPSQKPNTPEPAADYMADYDTEIDGLDDSKAKPKPVAKPQEKKPEGNVKPPEGTEPKKPEEGKEGAVEAPKPESEPKTIPELRKAHDTLKKRIKDEYEPKLAQAQARIAELEKNGDVKVWADRASAAEKRAAELDGQIKFVDYSRSQEFKEKFQQPYHEAWNRALADFGQLKVRVSAGIDEATGEPKFTFRQADQNDLLKLGNMPLSEMDEAAEAMFGKSSARVIRHVEKVRELADAQDKALADAQKNAGKHQEMTQAQQRQQREQGVKMWHESHKALLEKYPKFFGKDEADPEGNALLDKGTAEAERIFNRTAENAPKSAEEAVNLHALAYHKIANHDRLARRLKTARARIDELEKSLKEYEASGPPAGDGGEPGGNGTNGWSMDSEFAEIDKLDRR